MQFKLLFTAALLYCCISIYGQGSTPPTQTTNHIQPQIMVIPRVPDGKDMKVFYDADPTIQTGMSKINEAFLKRGAHLKSFDQALKQVTANRNINKASGNEDDYKSLVLQNAGADIYVEVKIDIVAHPARNAKSASIILEAYQTGTSSLLSSKTIAGPMFQTDDVGRLTMMAMDTVSESFLNLLQVKFDDIVENGQSVYVEFTIAPGSATNFDEEIKGAGGKLLSEVLDDWFAAHAVHGQFSNQGVTTNKLIISDVRIPLRKPGNPNSNYTGQNLFSDILKYLRSIGLQAKREIGTNNKILITIL